MPFVLADASDVIHIKSPAVLPDASNVIHIKDTAVRLSVSRGILGAVRLNGSACSKLGAVSLA